MQHTFKTIDAMRGVAALLVVMRHAQNYLTPFEVNESYLAVDLFFVISGFVLGYAYEHRLKAGMSPGQFMRVRFNRLYPLYLIAIVPAGIAAVFGTGQADAQWTMPNLVIATVLAILMLPAPVLANNELYPLNGPAWSLMNEAIVNVFYAAFWKRLTNPFLAGIAAFSAFAILVLQILSNKHLPDFGFTIRGASGGLARVFFSFPIGLLIYRLAMPLSVPRVNSTIAWSILVGTAILLSFPVPIWLRPAYGFVAITVISPALVYFAVRVDPKQGVSAFQFLGLISYAVYVLHSPILAISDSLLEHWQITQSSIAPYGGFVILAVIIGSSYLLDAIYDRRARKWLSKKPIPISVAA